MCAEALNVDIGAAHDQPDLLALELGPQRTEQRGSRGGAGRVRAQVAFPALTGLDGKPILTDITDPQVARDGIETEPPWFAEAESPNLWSHFRVPAKWIICGNSIGTAVLAMINVDAQHFPEEQLAILPMPLRVLLRTGVTHCEIEKPIGTKLDAAAAVILGDADDLQKSTRALSEVSLEVSVGLSFDENRCDLSLLEHLMLEVVFPVFAKARMKGQAEQPVWPALTINVAGEIAEQRLRVTARVFLQQPDLPRLMNG